MAKEKTFINMKRKMLCPFIITLIGAILMLVMLLLPYASANSEHKDYLIEHSDEIGMTNSEAVNISLVEFVRIYSEAINENINKETSIVCIAIIAIFAVFALITIILTLLKKPIGIIISDLLALVIFSIIHFDFKDRGVIPNRSYDWGITNYLTYIVGGVIIIGAVWMLIAKRRINYICTSEKNALKST